MPDCVIKVFPFAWVLAGELQRGLSPFRRTISLDCTEEEWSRRGCQETPIEREGQYDGLFMDPLISLGREHTT